MNTEKSKRGGAGRGQGRKAKPKVADVADKGFAARILERIGKGEWRITKVEDVKSAEDYALYFISLGGAAGQDQFNRCVEKRDGLAVRNLNHMHDKPVEHTVTLSISEIVREVRQRKEQYERNRA